METISFRVEPGRLVATQPGGLVHPARRAHVESDVGLGTRHEPSPRLIDLIPAGVVEIASAEDVVATGGKSRSYLRALHRDVYRGLANKTEATRCSPPRPR